MLVSFVVIAYNAGKTLPGLLECLNKQTYAHDNIEVVLVDGNSTDNTKDIMMNLLNSNHGYKRVVVLDNPKRTLPCGWNVALENVTGDTILRVDAHVILPEDFIELNVKNIEKGEDICGGKVISIPADNNNWSVTINQAENSMFGGSFAAFRHADTPRYVDTAAFAIYKKSVFDKVGKYNELLTRTEDNEMHYRMKQAGYKFYYDPKIVSYRETRPTFLELLRQKYLNGYWIGRTLKVEPKCFSLYHFVPFLFVIAIFITTIMLLFEIKWPALLLWGSYIIVDFGITILCFISNKERNAFFVLLPIMFFLLHFGYGVGTIIGLFKH